LDSAKIRFVVEDDGQFYISESSPELVTGGTGNQTASFNIEALGTSWYNYDPSTAAGVSVIGSAATPGFNDIDFIGFTLLADAIDAGDASVNFGVREFYVSAKLPAGPATVVLDAGLKHQKMEGFGASGAFYINRLITHNNASQLADLLFRDLGLDIFRIRNVYQHAGYETDANNTADTIQLGEAALGRPLKIQLSAWGPPAALKSNDSDLGGGTLKKDGGGNYMYSAYADWWSDSLDYYAANGIVPDYVSIQNEPNWAAAYQSCEFAPVETTNSAGYNIAFEAVWQKLAIENGTMNMPAMLGPETISFNKLDEYIDNLIVPQHAYGYAHHLYQNSVGENPDALNAMMAGFNAGYGYKPLFQTEYAVLNGNTNSPIIRMLNLAKLMHNALTVEEVSAYFYWALYWNGEQGLIDIPNSSTYTITPEYYAFKHYSAFIEADWRRIDASSPEPGVDLSAFLSPARDEVSVIIINTNAAAVNLELNFTNVVISGGDVFQTSETQNCVNVGSYNPALPIEIPGRTITTLALTAVPPQAPENPNILMICVDDLRPETRSYGAAQMITPNLDRLAADGYQFNRAYIQQAVCSPSRTSVLTGMRPDSTQVFDLETDFRDTIPWVETLPQYLQTHGYYSAGIGKIFHGGLNDDLSWNEPWSAGSGTYGSTGNVAYENAAVADNELRDGAVTDEAIVKLADLKTKQPFFYGVGYVRPHLPFVAPSAYWDLYSVSDLVLPHTDDPAVDASGFAYTTWGELRNYTGIPASGPVSTLQEQNLIHGYYACVSYMDAQLGRLMDALAAEGLDENTIVVVWGDHGWHLGDHGQWTKHTNFERATRIPMIVKVPWMPGASQIDALTEAVDLYPTLLDLCGIPHPVQLEGDSLVPLLEAPESVGDADAISQYPRSGNMGYSMRTDRYRYTEWRVGNSNILVERELYDHFLDPLEDTNVVNHAEYAADVAVLEAQLQARLDELGSAAGAMGDQLVTNGEFDDDLNNWVQTMNGSADALFTILPTDGSGGLGDDPLLHMEITNGSADKYRLAIEQIVPAQSGKLYTIRFDARAAASRTITILWRNKNNSTNAYLTLNVPIDNVARTYEFTGIQLDDLAGTDPDGEIRIQFGGDNADVWIDSIEIYAQATLASALQAAGLSGADALLNADADGDTVPNLFEYACNLDMTTNDYQVLVPGIGTSGLPTYLLAATNSFQTLELEYLRRRGASDLEYVAEFSGNLTSNVWNSGSGQSVISIDSDWERVIVQDSETTETATNRFGRVRILFKP
jgi:iduronate 2-sulfatase